MRIAVCFSGVLRTGCNTEPSLKKYFGDLYDNIDVFVHTWDYEHVKVSNTDCIGKDLTEMLQTYPQHPIIKSKLTKFAQLWNPIKMQVDSNSVNDIYQQTIQEMSGYNTYHGNAMPHQLKLSLYACNQLKCEYENEHDFKYDFVIRIRPDMVIRPIHTLQDELDKLSELNNSVLVCNLHDWESNHDTMINDVLYISNSDIMDTIAEYGNPKSTVFFTESLITYLVKQGITPHKSVIDGYAILRNYATHLDSINDFDQILIDEIEYNGSVEFYNMLVDEQKKHHIFNKLVNQQKK